MKLAGHADFKTTHKYYLFVRDDLVHCARQATACGQRQIITLDFQVKTPIFDIVFNEDMKSQASLKYNGAVHVNHKLKGVSHGNVLHWSRRAQQQYRSGHRTKRPNSGKVFSTHEHSIYLCSAQFDPGQEDPCYGRRPDGRLVVS
jgi:hypothetical protein